MRPVLAVSNMHWPNGGAKAIPFDFVFTASLASIQFDLAQEMEQQLLAFVQSMFIDNSANTNAFTLTTTLGAVSVGITVKGHTQGFYPVMIENGAARLTGSTTAAAVTVPVVFLNVAMAPIQWATQ